MICLAAFSVSALMLTPSAVADQSRSASSSITIASPASMPKNISFKNEVSNPQRTDLSRAIIAVNALIPRVNADCEDLLAGRIPRTGQNSATGLRSHSSEVANSLKFRLEGLRAALLKEKSVDHRVRQLAEDAIAEGENALKRSASIPARKRAIEPAKK